MEKESCDVVVCDFETYKSENEKFITHAKRPNIEDDKWGCIDISIMPSSCNKIVKKDLYGDLKYPIGMRYEDLATTLILLLKANKVVYMPKMYYKYTIRENSIMREKFDETKFKIIDILEILFDRLDKLKISKEDKDRAINCVCYERIYFELLDPLSKEKGKYRYNLTKKMCKKINSIMKRLNKNYYYIKQLNLGRMKRKLFANLVNIALRFNFPFLLCLILKSSVYYNNQYISDKWAVSNNQKEI